MDFDLEAERPYLAKRREGQRMQFAAAFRLRHDQAPMLGPAPYPRASPNGLHAACRINFLPSVLAYPSPSQAAYVCQIEQIGRQDTETLAPCTPTLNCFD